MSSKFEPLEELLKTELGECTEAPKVFVSHKFIKGDNGHLCNGIPCCCNCDNCKQDCTCDNPDYSRY